MTEQQGFREHKRVEPISELEPRRQVQLEPSEDVSGPSKVKFEEALKRADASKIEAQQAQVVAQEEAADSVKRQSLLELAKTKDATKVPPPTPESLVEQATNIRKRLEAPRAVLMGADTTSLPRGAVSALSGHVELMDKGLRDAMVKTRGVEVGSLVETGKPPLVRFLNFLTESDKRLSNLVEDIRSLDIKNQRVSPEKLLAVQIKLGFVQQELEFFTNVLNKALESTKTIMNVQI